MRLVCVTQAWWDKYVEICKRREALVSWPTKKALFVADGEELVAGCLIYDTEGPHVFFEHLVTNDQSSATKRHRAVRMMARMVLDYSRTVGKFPHILVRHAGLQKVLESVGMVDSGTRTMTCPPELLV